MLRRYNLDFIFPSKLRLNWVARLCQRTKGKIPSIVPPQLYGRILYGAIQNTMMILYTKGPARETQPKAYNLTQICWDIQSATTGGVYAAGQGNDSQSELMIRENWPGGRNTITFEQLPPFALCPMHRKVMFAGFPNNPIIFLLHGRNVKHMSHWGGSWLPHGDMSWFAHTYLLPTRPLSPCCRWMMEVWRATTGDDVRRFPRNKSTVKPPMTTRWAMSTKSDESRHGIRPGTVNAKRWSKL